jgi:hypothetical protein
VSRRKGPQAAFFADAFTEYLRRGVSSPDSKGGANSTESSSTGGTKNRLGREANKANSNKMKKSFGLTL